VNTTIIEKATQETRGFYPVVRPSNTCLLPRCGVPMDEGCTQPLSSDPMINLNTTVFSFRVFFRLREISTIWSLSPLQSYDHKESTRVRMREQHTQDSNLQHNHAHKSRLELETQHTESVTQIELKSLTQRIKCVESESRSLRMSLESLVYGSMCLGVPFIAPRQLGAVGDQFGRPSLTSVEWCTGQCGAPPDSHCHVRCTISFQIGRNRLLLLGAGWRTGHCPVHTGQSGATSRPLERATCRALIARTTVGAGAVGSSDSPVHHWTVR
jgi:hypothetical protein